MSPPMDNLFSRGLRARQEQIQTPTLDKNAEIVKDSHDWPVLWGCQYLIMNIIIPLWVICNVALRSTILSLSMSYGPLVSVKLSSWFRSNSGVSIRSFPHTGIAESRRVRFLLAPQRRVSEERSPKPSMCVSSDAFLFQYWDIHKYTQSLSNISGQNLIVSVWLCSMRLQRRSDMRQRQSTQAPLILLILEGLSLGQEELVISAANAFSGLQRLLLLVGVLRCFSYCLEAKNACGHVGEASRNTKPSNLRWPIRRICFSRSAGSSGAAHPRCVARFNKKSPLPTS